jgi:hypothetical protein
MRTHRFVAALLLSTLAACTSASPGDSAAPSPSIAPAGSPAPASPAPPSSALPSSAQPSTAPTLAAPAAAAPAVLIGAGDISSCDSKDDSRTVAVLRRHPGTVFTLGDNAYPNGTRRDFARCYDPTWGAVKTRTRPVVGNHEYHTDAAAAYFDYFGAAAGPRGKGYYSYDAGEWHVVVLNSNCTTVSGGCRQGSAQQRWLRADLARSAKNCTVAMMHAPLFTSAATHPPATETRPLVQTLYDAGVEVLLAGHNHVYERFAPQTPRGRRDPAHGIREIVVGTGGAALYPFGATAPNSEVRQNDTFGVLRLTLRPGAYRWDFLPVGGGDFKDSGTGSCH